MLFRSWLKEKGVDPTKIDQIYDPQAANRYAALATKNAYVSLLNAPFDLRAVARDLFLDGNTFVHSHRVDRRPYVADVALGVAGFAYGWKFSYARVLRSREFEGQPSRHSFGSFTLTYAFD